MFKQNMFLDSKDIVKSELPILSLILPYFFLFFFSENISATSSRQFKLLNILFITSRDYDAL